MKNHHYATLLAAATVTFAVTSCQKESVRSMDQKHPGTELTRSPSGGIKSIGSWTAGGGWIDYFEINPSFIQKPDIFAAFGPASGSSPTRVYAASGTHEAFAYRDGATVILVDDNSNMNIITLGGANFNAAIQELEIDPATQEVYAIARTTVSGPIQLYHIDRTIGAATLVGNLSTSGTAAIGSFTFVPNSGLTGYSLLHVTEPGGTTPTTATMKYWNISGTTMTAGNTVSITGNFAPGTGSLNMCYGNGKLYFARDAGNLYAVPFASIPLSGTAASMGTAGNMIVLDASFDNRYDFGYYGI